MDGDLAAWGTFYVMLGGAAAALTGLIVVAMSIHARAIARSAPHRGIARGSLTGLVGVVVISGFALFPGQTTITFGTEIAAVGAVLFVTAILLVLRARKLPDGWDRARRVRATLYIGIPLLVAVLGVLTATGLTIAPYLVAAALVTPLALIVNNAWALLLDVSDEDEVRPI